MYPILVRTPWFDIHTYGLLLAAAFGAGILLAGALARGEGLSAERFTDLGLVALVAGIVGGRLMYVAVELDQFVARPLDVFVRRDGFVFYGGLIVATAAVYAAARRWGLPIGRTADILAPCVALGQSIGRLGCYAEGCCFGRPTEALWGVTFPPRSYAFATQVADGLLSPAEPFPLPVHPAQLVEALGAFALFAALMWLRGRRDAPEAAGRPLGRGRPAGSDESPARWSLPEGGVLAAYLGGYALLRLVVEALRGDDRGASLLGLTPGQATSLLLAVAAAVLWRRLTAKPAA